MKAKKLHFIIFFPILIVIILASFASANDRIYFKLNQTEYYFLINEEAKIPLETINDYGQDMQGIISYTTRQSVQQAGLSYSSQNSNSQNFVVPKGDNMISLDAGTLNSQGTINLDITYDYNDPNGTKIILTVPSITINFVQNEQDKKNTQNSQTSSSKTEEEQQQEQQKAQEEAQNQAQAQADEQMKQQQIQNQMQNRLQNNQMPQNTDSIKKEVQEQEKMNQEFADNLAKKQQFLDAHKSLLDRGYNLTDYRIDAESNETGNFTISYKNTDGENATMQGSMSNGTITGMKTTSTEDGKKIIEKIRNNQRYVNYNNQLKNAGFNEQPPTINTMDNITTVDFPYTNDKNETSKITAEVVNNEIKKISLEKNGSNSLWIMLAITALISIIGVLVYLKLKKQKTEETDDIKMNPDEETFDYKKEAKDLLHKSKELFKQERYKDAFEKASQAIRVYESYRLKLKKELTNQELIHYLKKSKEPHEEIEECLNHCSSVEFAKYSPNKKDFDKIMGIAEKMIR